MIKILSKDKTLHIGTCNACSERKASVELKFKSKYSTGGTVIALCNECIKELQERIDAIELSKVE